MPVYGSIMVHNFDMTFIVQCAQPILFNGTRDLKMFRENCRI